MICGDCNSKPTASNGANLMVGAMRKGTAYPFCDRRGNRVYPFVFTLDTFAKYTQLPLKYDARLNGKRILAIEVVSIAAAPKVGGVDNVGGVATGILVMVRRCGSGIEKLAEIPLPAMDRSANGGKLYFTDLLPTFGACYLVFTGGSYTSANALQFNFHVQE